MKATTYYSQKVNNALWAVMDSLPRFSRSLKIAPMGVGKYIEKTWGHNYKTT